MEMIDDSDNDFDLAMMEQMPWLETPLDTRRPCIRILKLHKGTNDSPITCSLQVADLDDDPEYESLSYVWGDPAETKPITVSGETFNATENLVDFLHCLRLQIADRLLWVDAVCINQQDDKEKIVQLRLMARIYRQANEAHIWFGYFSHSWSSEIICDSGKYIRAREMTPHQWTEAERICRDDLRHFLKAGGKPEQQHELFYSEKQSCEELLSQTLDVLDRAADGMHLHEFPIFFVSHNVSKGDRFAMNRHWLTILDCIRWLLSRRWWTRVWTLQEAVLPRVDSLIHAHPYSFRISRLLNGIDSMIKHRHGCCKDLGRLFLGEFQSFPFNQYIRAITLHDHRERFTELESQWLTLEEAISSTQARKATDPRDHFFGILGLLPQEWQDIWIRDYDYSYTAAEIFGQCTKLLYTNSYSLEKLSSAIGVKGSEFPSWSIDLSNQLPNGDNDHHRWVLYDASGQSRFEGIRLVLELAGPSLAIKAIPIGTVGACARRVSHDRLHSNMVLSHISEWQRLYEDYTDPLNTDRFWRAAFMDRDIQRDWLHKRKQLPRRRLDDINRWWRSWNETGESQDLDLDKQAGDGSRGNYHYRALKLNAEKHRFFCTAKCEPALGPHDVQPFDEVYVLAGCQAPAILRRVMRDGKAAFLFVGLCFVDGWMYGEATFGQPEWQTAILY
ncbi:HET-domain-containing protein [Hyaloscypha bicolor E]|uniref:HET-domain-containing protein n=1 Tax=Hyaloscypha bicolor E TaxID=1095630 RepID=A0A2J6TBT0_9HELO|nr:HET-domain-containing protein [Hyaloscypha bicolor E]PMD60443.1 HET-domain-containing protein [Hyaloscypha bicolor E]